MAIFRNSMRGYGLRPTCMRSEGGSVLALSLELNSGMAHNSEKIVATRAMQAR